MWKWLTLLICMASSSAHAAKWSYEGYKNGQGEWGELSEEYKLCDTGTRQSPVNLSKSERKALPPLAFHYPADITRFTIDRFTVVSTPRGTHALEYDGKRATLREMLIRSPSEHEIGETFYPLELQFVHERAEGGTLVVSVFVKIGAANPAIQTIADHYPKKKSDTESALLEWSKLLPPTLGYYTYEGSIPYPPCTEGVEFLVLKTPIEGSMEQIKQIIARTERNSRATQPLLMRTISESD